MQDLVGGQIDLMCAEASQTLTYVRGGKMKAQFKQAERVGARYALVLGGNEVLTGQAKLKDMATREETPVALAELVQRVG